MGNVTGYDLKISLFLFIIFCSLSSGAINYSTNTSGTISNTLIWSDSNGNHPAGFLKPNDIFLIQAGHTMLGVWACHSTTLLKIEGKWNNASGTIGSIIIVKGGSVTQSGKLILYGQWIQNSTYIALCDTCSVTFSGNSDQFVSSDAGIEITFSNLVLSKSSGFNLNIKANIIINHDLDFNSESIVNVYPGCFVKIKGKVNYPFTSDAFYLQADSGAYGSLLYDGGTIKGKVTKFVRGGKLGTEAAIKHFVSSPVKDQTGAQLIDNTLGNYNVLFFDSVGPDSTGWKRLYSNDPIIPGKGYYVAYNGHKLISYEGLIVNDSVKVVLYDSNNWTLVGNPYPSAIDGAAFLTEKNNLYRLSGVVYFLEQSAYNNPDDYIMMNLSGQLSKVKDNYPSDNIARSQGFWVQSTLRNKSECVFSNDMKTSGTAKLYAVGEKPANCFLGLENKNGYFQKQLLAFTDKAGKYYDKLYDAYTIDDSAKSPLSFYSLIEGNKSTFEIQGLNFNIDTTTIKLGYYTTVAGSLTISLEKLSSFPDSMTIFLLDRQFNVLTNLRKIKKYIFNSAAGRFNDRFKIYIFPDTTTSIDNSSQSQANWILQGKDLIIIAQSKVLIESIIVYNNSGQSILNKDRINKPNYTINLSGCNGPVYVRALINGKPEVRKFIVTP
jgi:hypothetical protein